MSQNKETVILVLSLGITIALDRAVQLVTVQPGNRTSYGYEFVPISGL